MKRAFEGPLARHPPTMEAAGLRLAAVRPAEYARTRNHLDGAVTGLSPYITHALLSLPQVLDAVLSNHPLHREHRFVQELGWREFFQHVWQWRGDGLFRSVHDGPLPDAAYARELPADIRHGATGIAAIDTAVRTLYATGTLHNHARMWLASYVVHGRKVHWRAGADWMVAHLLDGDLASNHGSWQWVAGTGSAKPYLFNAENVARYAPRGAEAGWSARGSALDTPYEALDDHARDPQAVMAPWPRAAAVDEPDTFHDVPPGLDSISAPCAASVAGRDVELVHAWMLGEPAPGRGPAAVRVGVFLSGFHRQWAWSRARWGFVASRMAALCDHLWWADAHDLASVLAGARSVRSVANPHLGDAQDLLARTGVAFEPAPRLFSDPGRDCTSFSGWWSRVRCLSPRLAAPPGRSIR